MKQVGTLGVYLVFIEAKSRSLSGHTHIHLIGKGEIASRITHIHTYTHTGSPSEHEASCLNRFSREEGVFIIDKWDGYDQKNLDEERNLSEKLRRGTKSIGRLSGIGRTHVENTRSCRQPASLNLA